MILQGTALETAVHETLVCLLPEERHGGYRLYGAAKKKRENAACRRKGTARWNKSGWRPGR